MNKNKKEYVEAINEIKVSNEIKAKLLKKIQTKEESDMKRWFKNPYVYGLASLVIVLIFTTAIVLNINKNVNKIEDIEVTASQLIAENKELPTVDNFENLYALLRIEEKKQEVNGYLLADMGTSLDSTREMVAEESAISKSADFADRTAGAEGRAAGVGSGGLGESDDFSNTNVQIEGVDEADIVKTDGQYIYYVSSSKVVIVDAKDPSNLKILSEIEDIKEGNETFSVQELFINSNKLIAIGTKSEYENRILPTTDGAESSSSSKIMVDTIYPYYYNAKNFTVAKVYNVSNKSNPVLEREVQIEGGYLSSRMIGSNIYFMSNKYISLYGYYNTRKEEINEDEFKPLYRDTQEDEELKCLPFPNIYYCPESEITSYLNLAGFDVNSNKPANIESVLGAGENVFASESSLYISNTKYEYDYTDIQRPFAIDTEISQEITTHTVTTTIYKFILDSSKVTYKAAGQIPGYLVNQFSMDESNGYFRVAATNSTSWNDDSSTNNVYVLDNNMQMVGKLENLAPGEKIYSVRFMGNKAYMVTFVTTDPLFVIDLSNPTNPKVLGELKIPGYSKYLHPYDENHIIGFGENTKTVNYGYGEVVTTDGMKMALFDVTDPTNPKEMYSVDIGEKGTSSGILYNHKALLFSKEKNIIAFPISISKQETVANGWTANYTFQGAIVYGLDLKTGFTLKGQITHKQMQNGYTNYDYNREVDRIIYIKDNLYTLSKGLIKATDMVTMQEKGSVEIKIAEPEYKMIEGVTDIQEITQPEEAIAY